VMAPSQLSLVRLMIDLWFDDMILGRTRTVSRLLIACPHMAMRGCLCLESDFRLSVPLRSNCRRKRRRDISPKQDHCNNFFLRKTSVYQ
jgi:hypothetical protein